MTKTAFVAGATGYTGRAVVGLLAERDIDVVAHVRPDSSRLEEWKSHFTEIGARVDTTPWEKAQMRKTLQREEPDLLFYLIGTTRARDRKSNEDNSYEAIDYGLFKLLLDACGEAGAEPRVVYLSAIGVRSSARSAYYRVRWRAEEKLRDSGLAYLIARPAMITGPNRDEIRVLERAGGMLADVASGGLRLIGASRLADRYRSRTNVELATALVEHALEPESAQVVLEGEELG